MTVAQARLLPTECLQSQRERPYMPVLQYMSTLDATVGV